MPKHRPVAAEDDAARSRGLTAAALVNELLEAREEKRLLRLQKQLAKQDLLIVDELGYVPLSKTGAELLFEIVSQRYEQASTLVTSNLPFNEWTEIEPPALAMPANKKKDPRYAEIYRDMPGYSGMRPRRLRPMIVGVPPRVGAAYAGIGRRNCGSRLLIHQMAFKPRFPGVLGSLK